MVTNDEAHHGDLDADELALLSNLREAGRADAVPVEMVTAARSAFIWRTLDAELAELTYDSVMDDDVLAGLRSSPVVGAAAARFLTFEAPGLTVEVEVSGTGEHRRLIGQLVPPHAGRVVIRHPSGSTTVDADDIGRFSADHVSPGPVSLECRSPGGEAVVTTDWVLV